MSVAEVLAEVLRDRMFHDQSGGGVTLSGGEPLMQGPFCLALLKAFHERSIHTALDTCGYAAPELIAEVAPWVNLFLYDLKSMDDIHHRELTGVSNAQILENLKTLSSSHARIWVRIPLVPGFNLDEDQLRASARFIATISGVQQVNLLPYHPLGTHKQGHSGSDSAGGDSADGAIGLPEVEPIAQEQLNWAADLFRAAGLRTLIGG